MARNLIKKHTLEEQYYELLQPVVKDNNDLDSLEQPTPLKMVDSFATSDSVEKETAEKG